MQHAVARIIATFSNTPFLQIRLRRLAMLGSSARRSSANEADNTTTPQPSSAASPPSQMPPQTETSEPAAPMVKINVTPAVEPAQSSPNPFTQLGVQSTQLSGDQPASAGSPRPSRKRHATEVDHGDSASAPRKDSPQPAQQQRQDSDEDYAHRVLSQIFRVSVDPHHMSNVQGQRLVFLPNLNHELNDSGDPLKLSISTLDQAIIEACNNWPPAYPLFDYLLPCWKRAVKAASTARNVSPQRQEVLEEAKRLCMSNCLFALTMPALYGFVDASKGGALAP